MTSPDLSPLETAPFSGRTLLVLGAGYVGEAVCRGGLARGMRVVALTRNPEKAAALGRLGVETVVAALDSHDWHSRVPDAADFVLNAVSSGGGGVEGYRRSYVDGGRSLLAWARTVARPGALIYTSSTSVYPQGDGARVDEDAPTDGTGETALILLEAEALARSWPGPHCVLRLAGIYGPGRHLMLDQLRTGARELTGRGDHRLNLIHRDDIAEACWTVWGALRGTQASWTFNLADNDARPKAEVAAWLANRLGVAVPTFTEMPTPGRRRQVPDRIIVNSRIRTQLGWRPRFPTYRDGYEPLLGA